jgi:phosphotransferase system HPr-like phosphotransfer protein
MDRTGKKERYFMEYMGLLNLLMKIEQHGVIEIEEGSKEHKILQAVEALLRSLREKEVEEQVKKRLWF